MKTNFTHYLLAVLILFTSFIFSFNSYAQTSEKAKLHTINIRSCEELHDYFRYSSEKKIIVSGHRGGMMRGFPENSLETFENTLSLMECFFEIDPHITKDGIIVLMHDSKIDRTTNGTGKVSDYTYEELRQFYLTDMYGNITAFKIPTLQEAIEWSRGKTILNIDKKDVPYEMIADLLKATDATNVMLTVHSPEHAQYYLSRNPKAMFSAHIFDMETFNLYDQSGFPWSQAIVYMGQSLNDTNRELYKILHSKGVMVMFSMSPTHDKKPVAVERRDGYLAEIALRPDIIESDYPFEFIELDTSK